MHEHLHGMHGHVFGDVSNNCTNQGGHYNPHQIPHGGQDAAVSRHPGDFGNLKVEDDGTAAVMFNDTVAALFGPHSLLGRGIVIHAGADDLGLAGTEASRKSGNAGARIACCAVVATPPHKGVWPDE
nr:hypothetical protein BaRGS_033126 [Batillaria attramentaria]